MRLPSHFIQVVALAIGINTGTVYPQAPTQPGPLIELFSSDNEASVRVEAIRLIAKMNSNEATKAVPSLISIAKNQAEENEIKEEVINALENIGDDRAVDVLLSFHNNRALSFSARQALAKIALRDPKVADELLDILDGDSNTEEVCQEVAKTFVVLFEMDKGKTNGIQDLYKDTLKAYVETDDPQTASLLFKPVTSVTNHTYTSVSNPNFEHSGGKLIMIALEELEDIAGSNQPLQNRINAVKALGKMEVQDDQVLPILTNLLKDPEWQIRLYAARGIGRICSLVTNCSDKTAVHALDPLLKDDHPQVVAIAAWAIYVSNRWNQQAQGKIVQLLENAFSNEAVKPEKNNADIQAIASALQEVRNFGPTSIVEKSW